MSLEMIISQNSIALTLFRNYLSQFFILECIFCQIYQKKHATVGILENNVHLERKTKEKCTNDEFKYIQ